MAEAPTPVVLSPVELSALSVWYEGRIQAALGTWSGRASDKSRLVGLQSRLAELTAALAVVDPMPAPEAPSVVQGAGLMLPPGYQTGR